MKRMVDHEIRNLVREMIPELIAEVRQSHRASGEAEVRKARISDDTDLAAFVNQLLDLMNDAESIERVRSGKIRFSLARGGPSVDELRAQPQERATSILRIEKGAVTEKMILQAKKEHGRVVLGKGAVLTPLARESARRHGVTIERAS